MTTVLVVEMHAIMEMEGSSLPPETPVAGSFQWMDPAMRHVIFQHNFQVGKKHLTSTCLVPCRQNEGQAQILGV